MMSNYEGRAAVNRHINGLVRQWVADKSNVTLLRLDEYLLSEDDFLDTLNHFKKGVYYRFAEGMISYLDDGAEEMGMRGKRRILYEVMRQKAEALLRKMGIYKKVRGVWRYLRKKRTR